LYIVLDAEADETKAVLATARVMAFASLVFNINISHYYYFKKLCLN